MIKSNFKSTSKKISIGRFLNKFLFSKLGFNIIRNSEYMSAVAPPNWPYRTLYFYRLLSLVDNVEGDIVECGTAGGSSLLGFLQLKYFKVFKDKHIWGFDSFQGLPRETKKDFSFSSKSKEGRLITSEAKVWSGLYRSGFSKEYIDSSITLCPGWFSDTLPNYEGSISLLHLDGDLYESTKCALENLWPKVSINGIVALDDYGNKDFPGEKKAVDEFFEIYFEDKGAELFQDSFFGGFYIIRLK